MSVGVPGERSTEETRVALVPSVARDLLGQDHEVIVSSGAGDRTDWSDAQYAAVGCDVVEDRDAVFERSDVILHVRALGAASTDAIEPYREGQTVIGLLGPYEIDEATFEVLADRRISAFALELLPRIGRAQQMDVLTSMASVAGYKAAVTAADALPSLFPMQMTAAGTVRPASVFVVGAGVAGLQAIATSKRLGARVRAYDIRPAVAEEVESLGADFLELDVEATETTAADGYAREQDAEFYRKQREAMTAAVGDADVVITSAAVPGRAAPTLVTAAMIEEMDAGSVVVDVAADGGGNCEPTRAGEVIEYDGVTVIGHTNLPARVAHTASQLFANNVANFLDGLLEDGRLHVDVDDEIVDATLLTHDGAVRAPHRRGGSDAA
ncbi:Re/Si-specific NAD(P)(+) transhydrogenase subunit alpha [Halobellus rufus]|uniref:Re/Si-specific NAD(P)(+) transhydrogenase subunit alpha n=1 Tax=Halobellus rufus TaxID=1448860 RepID=UPI0009E077F5|nr:Re/Si-specific NAD(P)(+) transhydrogenase subunit alpha [Halobellus rufus]